MDATWDILLYLFASQRPVTVNEACGATHAPRTTALRHLVKLEQAGKVTRAGSVEDRRVNYLELSPAGLDLMQAYYAQAAFHRA
jgi:DNA-binding MarR family transcriptional regulator